MYPDISNMNENSIEWLSKRFILTTTNNKDVEINGILDKFEGIEMNFLFVDHHYYILWLAVLQTDNEIHYIQLHF